MGKNKSSKLVNKRMVDKVGAGEVELVIYAKITGPAGGGRMNIYYEQSNRGYKGLAKIRGALMGKGRCPIQTNDIVCVTPREFESGEDANKHFDIICVFDAKEAYKLKKDNMIPDYFLGDVTNSDITKKPTDAFDFDYAADDEVNVDAI